MKTFFCFGLLRCLEVFENFIYIRTRIRQLLKKWIGVYVYLCQMVKNFLASSFFKNFNRPPEKRNLYKTLSDAINMKFIFKKISFFSMIDTRRIDAWHRRLIDRHDGKRTFRTTFSLRSSSDIVRYDLRT